jgi:V-type H+-transporting ATPase subunit a
VGNSITIAYLLGTVETKYVEKIQRMLFRLSRGTAFITTQNLDLNLMRSSKLGKRIEARSILLIVFPCGRDRVFGDKVLNVCRIFEMLFYDYLSPTQADSKIRMNQLDENVKDIIKVGLSKAQTIDSTKHRISSVVTALQETETCFGVAYMEHLKLYTMKEMGIIEMLSKLEDQGTQLYVSHFWCPESRRRSLTAIIDHLKETEPNFHGVIITKAKTTDNPPTAFYQNDFIDPFQQIVNTYGIPRYKEINPAPFSTATFPFMFGIMFGDIGHGAGLLIATLFLFSIDKNKADPGETITSLAKNKYLFLLMSFFSIYCGLIYNDYLALPTRLVKSCYNEREENGLVLFARKFHCQTPFGIDPVWGKSKNEITFLNSFKMKMSIIIGVLQMLFGLFLKGANNIYFGDYLAFCLEFIPQVLFMSCTFGYMCVCIVIKWLRNWSLVSKPPMIINTFINFTTKPDPPIFSDGDFQLSLQIQLLCRCR